MRHLNNYYLTSTSEVMNSIIWLIISIILIEILFIILIKAANKYYKIENFKKKAYSSIILSSVFLALAFTKPMMSMIECINDIKMYGEDRTHYEVYLNGNKVDYDNVCISDYKVYFVDSEKKILLSSK